MAGSLPHYSAVPGLGVPGRFAIGTTGRGYPLFLYEGHQVLTYLDYLNGLSGGTLVAVPGGLYAVLSAGHQNSFAVPPPDGRWNQPAIRDFVPFRPRVTLVEARAAIGPGVIPEPVRVKQPGLPEVCVQPGLAEVRARLGPQVKAPEAPVRVPTTRLLDAGVWQ